MATTVRSPRAPDEEQVSIVQAGGKFQLKRMPKIVSFDKGLFIVFKAAQMLRKVRNDVVIIGIAGASGAGKTFFSKKLATLLGEITVVSLDNYMKREEVVDDNFDDPRLVDFDILAGNLADLSAGRPTSMPEYSFAESRRVGFNTIHPGTTGVVIVEGIHALNSRIRSYLDVSVSVSGGVHYDLVKRVLRDIGRVGQSGSEVVNQVSETVYPMYKAFIEPDLQFAHVKVQNFFNPFDGFLSPIYILKSQSRPDEAKIESVLGVPDRKVVDTYTDIYLHPPGTEAGETTNWLRMRENKKKYNLMFSEWLHEGDFIISPRIDFEVNVKVLGGLMSLGYVIGFVVRRESRIFGYPNVTITLDKVADDTFVQIKGPSREEVAKVGASLGLAGTYDPRSYIEMVKSNLAPTGDHDVSELLSRMGPINVPSLLTEPLPSEELLMHRTPSKNYAEELSSLRRELYAERAARAKLESRLELLEQMAEKIDAIHRSVVGASEAAAQ